MSIIVDTWTTLSPLDFRASVDTWESMIMVSVDAQGLLNVRPCVFVLNVVFQKRASDSLNLFYDSLNLKQAENVFRTEAAQSSSQLYIVLVPNV